MSGAPGTPCVALAIICHQRPVELLTALASAAGEDFDERLVLDCASDPPIQPVEGAQMIRSDTNLGCSGGRNALVAAAAADVVAFMDDDAVLQPGAAERLREAFATRPGLGLVAFRVVREDGSFHHYEQPFRRTDEPITEARPCAHFIGAGFAVRREAYLAVGGSDERIHYLGDELPLAFRLMGEGWELSYEPSIVVEHRPSPRGRGPSREHGAALMSSHAVAARSHLPRALAALHIAAWVAVTVPQAARAGALGLWWGALRRGLTAPVDRRPLSWRKAFQAHQRGGRVLY